MTEDKVYKRYYGNFRGVDFESDHTSVDFSRCAYLSNMYKDHYSSQGEVVSAIPGFRRRFSAPDENNERVKINGIHYFTYINSNGTESLKILVHAGTSIYLWDNYPKSVNVVQRANFALPEGVAVTDGVNAFEISADNDGCEFVGDIAGIVRIVSVTGENWSVDAGETDENSTLNSESYTLSGGTLTINASLNEGDVLYIEYYERLITTNNKLYTLENAKSSSFVMNNKLYIIDGVNYVCFDGSSGTISNVLGGNTYLPTTYASIASGDKLSDREYENRNILNPSFKNSFVADGETTRFYLSESGLDSIDSVLVYGEAVSEGRTVLLADGSGYSIIDCDSVDNKTYLSISRDASLKENMHVVIEYLYNGQTMEKTARLGILHGEGASAHYEIEIDDCLELNYNLYNMTIYTQNVFDTENGYIEFMNAPGVPSDNNCPEGHAGIEVTASKALYWHSDVSVPFSELICGCRLCHMFDDRVFFSGNPLYPSYLFYSGFTSDGLSDPTYFGTLDYFAEGDTSCPVTGLMSVGDYLVILKRDGYSFDGSVFTRKPVRTKDDMLTTVYQRSQRINGVGCVALGGCLNFLDDPVFISGNGLSALGSLSASYERALEHRSYLVDPVLKKCDLTQATLTRFDTYLVIACGDKYFLADGKERYTHKSGHICYEWYPLEDIGIWHGQRSVDSGQCEGGIYGKSCIAQGLDNNLFFGTENGYIASFNFDQRDENGEIPTSCYTFDNRSILCGMATRMDNCDIPHMTKTTVKKTCVIKTKTFSSSAVKVKVRTNSLPYTQVDRLNSSRFDFNELDFSDISFVSGESSIMPVTENEKKWVEKQYYVYSDEYQKPFSLYYISYSYKVAGKVK